MVAGTAAQITTGLIGGLSIFLFGLNWLSESLKKVAGSKMRSLMISITTHRLLAMAVGAFVTVVMQSSSAITVMLVSFVQAGILNFYQTLAVILGADIGTTVTAQLVAFKPTDLGIPLLSIGFFISAFSKKNSWINTGQALFGLGLIFYGMKLMIDVMIPLRDEPYLLDLLHHFRNPLFGIIFAALFTALIQSSAAFLGITVVMAQQGIIDLEMGIPLILGSNIGTCITAGMASFKTTREAKRVALAHVGFKVVGVLAFVFWIPLFADLVKFLTVPFSHSAARAIANAHTLFNVILAFGFLPFTKQVAFIIEKVLPDEVRPLEYVPRVMHLNDHLLQTPSLALDVTRKEIARMAKMVQRMVSSCIFPFMSDSPHKDLIFQDLDLIEGIRMREKKVDFLEEKISEYLMKLTQQKMTEEQAANAVRLISVVNDLESMADIVHREILPLIEKKRALGVDFSPEGHNELQSYHLTVVKQLSRLEMAINEMYPERTEKIMSKMEKYFDLEDQLRAQHLERVRAARKESMMTHEIHMKLMDFLKQLNFYAGNMAKKI